MERNPVGWFEIYVQDMDRAKAFYQDVFGVEFSNLGGQHMEMWAFPMEMERAGCGGALVKMPGGPSGPGGTLAYFSCADCAVEADRAAKAGGRVEREKMSIGPYGFIALVYDTEGNMIGLHSRK